MLVSSTSAVNALAGGVLCVDDLQLFQQLPRHRGADRRQRREDYPCPDIRTAASNAHEPEPEWLAEASSHRHAERHRST